MLGRDPVCRTRLLPVRLRKLNSGGQIGGREDGPSLVDDVSAVEQEGREVEGAVDALFDEVVPLILESIGAMIPQQDVAYERALILIEVTATA